LTLAAFNCIIQLAVETLFMKKKEKTWLTFSNSNNPPLNNLGSI